MSRRLHSKLATAAVVLALAPVSAPLAAPAPADDAATVRKVRDLVQKAHGHFQDEDLKRAAKLYARADELAGGRAAAALNGLTRVSLELGEHAAAAETADRWLEIASSAESHAEALFFRGLANYNLGAAQRIDPLRAAVEGTSENGEADAELPPAGVSLERAVESLEASLAASEIAATRPLAALRLADAHADLHQMEEARAALATYAEVGGADPYADDLRCLVEALADAPEVGPDSRPEAAGEWLPGRMIEAPPIEWPERRPRSVEGVIVLELVIDVEGAVECVRVLSRVPHGFTEAVIAAAWQARYEPARLGGEPVPWRTVRGIAVSLETRPGSTRSPFGMAPPEG